MPPSSLTGCQLRSGIIHRADSPIVGQPLYDVLVLIATAPDDAARHPSLRRDAIVRLDLSDCDLPALPPEIGQLTALEVLQLINKQGEDGVFSDSDLFSLVVYARIAGSSIANILRMQPKPSVWESSKSWPAWSQR